MQIKEIFKISNRALVSNKSRTILTVLGIVVGITSVIMVFAAGFGLKKFVLGQLESFGTDLIQVEVKVPKTKKNSSQNAEALTSGVTITTLKLEDKEALKKLPNVVDAAAFMITQSQVVYENIRKQVNIFGSSASMSTVDAGVKVASGRFYTEEDEKSLARVALIGTEVRDKFFNGFDPVGKKIKIDNVTFEIIGVMAKRGTVFFMNLDDQIYIPITTVQKLLMGVNYVSAISLKMQDGARVEETVADIESFLRERHRITDPTKDDFGVTSMAEARDILNVILGGLTLLLTAIAAISLLVGGVGIMNIMYVSVTERVFEIGLRKALGARPQEILLQFLVEAIMVTLLGGVVGIILGVGLSWLVAVVAQHNGFDWQFGVPISSIFLSVGVSAGIGLIFGFFPARRAAKLDPIEALRQE